MKTIYARLTVALLLCVGLALPAHAQTALTETTLSAAVTTTSARVFQVTSATGFTVGQTAYVDREAVTIAAVSGTNISVTRGAQATPVTPHASGAPMWTGPNYAFIQRDLSGACTATSERYLPQINTITGAVYNCGNAGAWYNERDLKLVTCRALLVADQIDQMCFTAERAYLVTKITYVATTPESGGTLTVIPRKTTGTSAPSAGTALATAIDAVGTAAQTVATATLSATASALALAAGNRLALDFTDDVAGELAGTEVTFYLSAR